MAKITKQRTIVQVVRPPADEVLINDVQHARLQALYAEKALIERTIHLIKTMQSLGIIKPLCLSETVSREQAT